MKPETKRKKRIAKNQLYLFQIQSTATEQEYIEFWNAVQQTILQHLEEIQQADENTIKKYSDLSREQLESLILQGKIKLTMLGKIYDYTEDAYMHKFLVQVCEALD
jgi:uncharacterized protein YjgD (DUF1641 family)